MRRARGEGCIHQRSQNLWEGKIKVLGRRKTIYGRTQAEVQAKLLDLRRPMAPIGLTEEHKVKDALEFWLGSIQGSIQGTTWDRYRDHCNLWLIPTLGANSLTSLSPATISALYLDLGARGVSPAGIRKIGGCLRGALAWLQRLGWAPGNPALQIPLPRAPGGIQRPLNRKEVSLLLEGARGSRFEALYHLALDSGARMGEMFALTEDDIVGEEVRITKSLQERGGRFLVKEPKTRSGRRRVRLSPSTLQLLEGNCPFRDSRGGYLRRGTFHHNHWQPLLRKVGLRCRFHDLRHTCATLLLEAGVNPKVVSERLGHGGIEITLKTYGHVLPSMQEKAQEVMEGILKSQ